MFEAVEREGADGGRGGGVAAGVEREPAKDFREQGSDVAPRAHVLRLFLTPDEAGTAVVIGKFSDGVFVQRIELLNTHDGRIRNLVFGAVVAEIVVNFSRAEDQALGLGRLAGARRYAELSVVDDLLESAGGELGEFRDGGGVAEE